MSDINKKSFNLINRISKSFNITIANFAFAATLIFRIIMKIPITFVSKATMKMNTLLNMKRIRLIISQVRLSTRIVQTISLKKITITYILRQSMKAIVTINFKTTIGFTMRARQKIVSIINGGKIRLNIAATLAKFYTLGDFDSQTLGTLDAEALGDMDYTLV